MELCLGKASCDMSCELLVNFYLSFDMSCVLTFEFHLSSDIPCDTPTWDDVLWALKMTQQNDIPKHAFSCANLDQPLWLWYFHKAKAKAKKNNSLLKITLLQKKQRVEHVFQKCLSWTFIIVCQHNRLQETIPKVLKMAASHLSNWSNFYKNTLEV